MKFNEIVTIDLGSNSFRVLKYDYKNHKIISEFNEVVGMADGLVETLNISKDAMIRVINAINKASQDLNFDPKDAVCVTTAAMRKALNNKEVLSFFEEKTGAKFSIIDANEEARLTLLAVKYALKREEINSENFVLLDIGGGSTEIVVNTAQNYEAKSFDFGIVTMTQKSIKKEDLEKDLNDRKIQIKEFLNSLKIDLKDYSFVATAGTPTTIAAIKLGQDYFSYDRNIVNGTKVNLNDLEDSLKIFKNHSKDELTKLVGQGRVEFMEVGTYIYKMVFEVLQKDESIVLDDGLREGVAINYALNKVN
ncbi:Ppx/GppA phosphatase family protein [Aliarcobacter butzleri]|uniref:Ppx/GppA phosphatase family protein n=1 Tax=Aliarcobacter butzleri TaxID=28197 RepID=UPI00125ED226|nr:exopolyphosphatase [Aliarcobacter butzleri]MCT7626713.1 exopolyphosphatase [Aliarcobacter butzleri]MCT7636220.1 exopolyphosphatase [Aliarcobacter butzleri]MCT7638306.1 exopolyphosphatase [Aliarcobacter butzleri]MCT7642705.1 exopolyphosphatase [Aliarcobacter butzleri]MDK2045958.1 exopolyphosphatase [Aliarcobacter butzleri]